MSGSGSGIRTPRSSSASPAMLEAGYQNWDQIKEGYHENSLVKPAQKIFMLLNMEMISTNKVQAKGAIHESSEVNFNQLARGFVNKENAFALSNAPDKGFQKFWDDFILPVMEDSGFENFSVGGLLSSRKPQRDKVFKGHSGKHIWDTE